MVQSQASSSSLNPEADADPITDTLDSRPQKFVVSEFLTEKRCQDREEDRREIWAIEPLLAGT